MRRLIITTLIAVIPSISYGQSDLQKIGRVLQSIQQSQQQQRQSQGQTPPSNGGNYGPRQAPVQGVDPNASGNQNTGRFDPNSFFEPNNGGGNYVPSPGRTYPQRNTYPGNSTYPGTTQIYRNGVPINSYTPGATITGGQSYRPNYSQPTRKIWHPDPPIAPAKTYSRLPIVIRCAANTVGTCNYELMTASGSVFPYTINGGKSQKFTENTTWMFRYQPTPGAPKQTYRLRGGKTYEIRKNGNAWQVYMAP